MSMIMRLMDIHTEVKRKEKGKRTRGEQPYVKMCSSAHLST